MNRNRRNMKLFKRLMAAFMMITWMTTACAVLPTTTSPPTPVVKFPFDVSKRDSTVNQEFRIRDYRSYYFALQFNYIGYDDARRVFKLVGDGSPTDPGIHVPIHVKIYKLDTGNSKAELTSENTVSTINYFVQGFEHNPENGFYDREIVVVNLKPGIYRVEANTIKETPEFSGTPTYLEITWYSSK
jgi:hypothetical protein